MAKVATDMDFSKISLLVIAGGQSSRMKQDKRLIELSGVGLLERILIKASKQNFFKTYICVEEKLPFIEELSVKYNAEVILDKFKKAGPMAGLAEGLSKINTDWALALSCDMPFFDFKAIELLLNSLDNSKVVMFHHQPLAAFYHKSLSTIFSKSIEDNQRKLQWVINQVPNKIFEVKLENVFFNINTPTDLRLAQGREENINRKVPVISIIAPSSGTGKTTFIERMIPKLRQRNIRVGVIKSDAHGFDVKGKDSFRFREAGAESIAVVSVEGYMLIQRSEKREDFEVVARQMKNVDLIITESRTHGTLPALSLYRGLGEPIIGEAVVAIFTDRSLKSNDVLECGLNDIEQAVKMSEFLMGR